MVKPHMSQPAVEERARVNVALDRELWKKLKVVAAEDLRNVGDIVDELVEQYLKSRKPRQSRGS